MESYSFPQSKPFKVNDRLILLIAVPVLSVFFAHLGCSCALSDLLRSPFYYYNLLFNAVLITALSLYIRKSISRLNQKYSWQTRTITRATLQFFMNLVLPIGLTIMMCYLFGELTGVPFRNIFRWHIELPVVMLMIILVNGFFEILHFLSYRMEKDTIERDKSTSSIMLQRGGEFKLIAFYRLAYFHISHDNVFAVTFEGEKLLTNKSLDNLEDEMPDYYFRLNRQFIVNFSAIKGFRKMPHQKLSVELAGKEKMEVIISKKKSPRFKSWIGSFQK